MSLLFLILSAIMLGADLYLGFFMTMIHLKYGINPAAYSMILLFTIIGGVLGIISCIYFWREWRC